MQQVDHPNIVKYYETYEDKKFIYLCMELMTGGELIDKKNTVSEENAAFYFARNPRKRRIKRSSRHALVWLIV